jgi:hypothetical protein
VYICLNFFKILIIKTINQQTAIQTGPLSTFDFILNDVRCQFIRIHITDVVDQSQLTLKQSGFIITDILGSLPTITSNIIFVIEHI